MNNERQFYIATSWGLHETTVGRIVRKVENLLIKCGAFSTTESACFVSTWVGGESDGSGCGRNRNRTSKKNQKQYYSGKQHCHTMKAQMVIELETGLVLCTDVDKGRVHDFKLLKRSRLPFVSSQLCLADKGYQGFSKRHRAACLPTKKPRNQPLPEAEKQHNRALARLRVRVEHVIRRFKIFRIFSGRYRNRRRRFGLRLNLIAGLLNYELAHTS